MRWLVILLSLGLGLPAAAHEARPGSAAGKAESAATRAVDAFGAALRRGDGPAAAALLDPEAVIFEQGGAEEGKAEYVAAHLPADMAFAATTTTTITARQARTAGDLAYAMTQSRTRGQFRGKPVDSAGVETMVLRRVKGRWRIVHIHWSSARSAAPAS